MQSQKYLFFMIGIGIRKRVRIIAMIMIQLMRVVTTMVGNIMEQKHHYKKVLTIKHMYRITNQGLAVVQKAVLEGKDEPISRRSTTIF